MQQSLITCNTICSIILKDNTLYDITSDLVQMYKNAFPRLNIIDQLNRMAMWCFSNPSQRKTKRGILRFINAWLARAKPEQTHSNGSTVRLTRDRTLQDDLSDRSWAS